MMPYGLWIFHQYEVPEMSRFDATEVGATLVEFQSQCLKIYLPPKINIYALRCNRFAKRNVNKANETFGRKPRLKQTFVTFMDLEKKLPAQQREKT